MLGRVKEMFIYELKKGNMQEALTDAIKEGGELQKNKDGP